MPNMKKGLLCGIVSLTGLLLYIHLFHKDTYNSAVTYVSDGTQFFKKRVGMNSDDIGPRVTIPATNNSTNKVLENILDAVVRPATVMIPHTDQKLYKIRRAQNCFKLDKIRGSRYGVGLKQGHGISFFTKYNDDYKFLYCSIPKVASTNWKRMMIVLSLSETERSKLTKEKVNNMKGAHNDPRVKSVLTKGSSPDSRAFSDFYKFVFFRHPFTRMVSAWRNKFQSEKVNKYFYSNFGISIIQITRGDKGVKAFYKDNASNLISFKEFVIGVKSGVIDRHWMPQTEVCLPCSMDYTFVGFFEYLTNDTNYILDQIGIDDEMIRADHISSNGQKKSTTQYTQELFNDLPQQDIDDLYQFYQKDFVLFGYDKDVNSPTFPYPSIAQIK